MECLILPEDLKSEGKIKVFAFHEFSSNSDAMAAFQRLRKPDVFFGRHNIARVVFVRSPLHPSQEVLLQADDDSRQVSCCRSIQASSPGPVMSNAKKFCYNRIPPELEEKLYIMFRRIVATGENVWIPNSSVLPPELNDDHTISYEEDYTQDEQTNLLHVPTNEPTGNYNSQRTQQSATFLRRRKRVRTPKSGTRELFLNLVEDLMDAAKSISSIISTSKNKRRTFTILDILKDI
ncbi:hypothetical protein MA16_Dca000418 [Dendrobium catenatum]|uniref:RRM domain-containing protein n=1 Tax=Dendrobium catenatum TaxID=906689 RepID=A0A2I0WTT7_9ASPA|nr:hypothetical protein MA16_Dca000418 [Dendrobium catenatum]